MLRGALAAAVTPLRDEGAALDEEAFRPYLEFLNAAGLDGILALGTTGEGILLSAAERRRAAELFLEGPLPVIVHCGAQTSAETSALAAHTSARGARGRGARRPRAALVWRWRRRHISRTTPSLCDTPTRRRLAPGIRWPSTS